MSKRIIPAGLLEAASQRIVLTDSTAISVDGTVRTSGANVLIFSVETNHARMSVSGTPTLTTGVLLRTDTGPYYYEGYDQTSKLRFQRNTGTCVVNIEAYKMAGS